MLISYLNSSNNLVDSFRFTEKIANTERHLDIAKGHSNRAEDNANEIKKLNRSIFIPVVSLNKTQKRLAEEQKRLARHEEEQDERENTMREIRDSQNRVGRAATYGRTADDDEEGIAAPGGYGRRTKTATEQNLRKEQRKRYQFEATASDDEMEDELDDNLDEISDMTKRLKALGTAMGQELDQQNTRLGRIEGKTTKLDSKLVSNTDKVCLGLDVNFIYLITHTFFAAQEDSLRSSHTFVQAQNRSFVSYGLFTNSLWISIWIYTISSLQRRYTANTHGYDLISMSNHKQVEGIKNGMFRGM